MLRGIKPEARITIDGKSWDIGGLVGQRNYAFLDHSVLSSLQTDPQAFQFVGHEVRKIQERMPWKQIRPHAPDVAWPPRGVELRFDFVMPKTENLDLAVSVHYEPCASHNHPGHHDLQDSRWNQWQQIATFYRWCRGQGLFLNVPDHYFMSGSNKTGMGYREVNWSLPREEQTIHTRQNIYDGTWQKTPSMGWMFVPLTEYHGGGPKATIEPLDRNIDHYRNMIQSNLALGVQACYRGPRLYDTDQVKEMVKSQVNWYKAHREILESDLIHGQRADAKSLDWMLHANPKFREKGLVAIFNPTGTELSETLQIPLYYTGIRDKTTVVDATGNRTIVPLDRKDSVALPVTVAPHSMQYFVFE